MTFPNVLTIYFQEKHQKFPIGFERFGTDIASIGMGEPYKKRKAGDFSVSLSISMNYGLR